MIHQYSEIYSYAFEYYVVIFPHVSYYISMTTFLVVVSIPLAGCTSLPGGRPDGSVEIGGVTVENTDETAHLVHVLVERNSAPVYGTTVTLEAVSSPTDQSGLRLCLIAKQDAEASVTFRQVDGVATSVVPKIERGSGPPGVPSVT
jgi:hypothetical protein